MVECLDKDCIQKSCCANDDADDIQIELKINNDGSPVNVSKSTENVEKDIINQEKNVSSGKAKSMLSLNVSQLSELNLKRSENDNQVDTTCNKNTLTL